MTTEAGRATLGLGSGIGLVVANMIGAGVFLSAGFMAQELTPPQILAAWALGSVLALCGAVAYGQLAVRVPRSGGEYRFLSDLLHPAVGFLAGWASLLIGFAAPVALNGIAIGAFLDTLFDAPDPRLTGTAVIALLTLFHAVRLDVSKWTQNALVLLKLVGIVGFVGVGLTLGSWTLPAWAPPEAPASLAWPFLRNQFWIAFAFSGWNAAIYAASEFRDPARDVPRAMWLGTLLVSVLYLAVNGVLLANLSPGQLATVLSSDTSRITLGHLVAEQLLGPVGAVAMSVFVIGALISATSAMTLVGPRVYAEMAADGFLPRVFAMPAADARPPVGSLLLQAAVAISLLLTHSVLQIVQNVSAVLMVFTGLAIVAMLRLVRSDDPPHPGAVVAGLVYLGVVALVLYVGFASSPHLIPWVGGVVAVGLAAYAWSRRRETA